MKESLDDLLMKCQSPKPLQSRLYDHDTADKLADFFKKHIIQPKTGESESERLKIQINLRAQDLLSYLSASGQERTRAAKKYIRGRIRFLEDQRLR